MGYEAGEIIEAQGHARGIWVLVEKSKLFQVEVLDTFPQAVTLKILKGTSCWVCTAIYANPHLTHHDDLWPYLIALRRCILQPWLLLGDFNEIVSPLEVKGGNFSLWEGWKIPPND